VDDGRKEVTMENSALPNFDLLDSEVGTICPPFLFFLYFFF
jgi:hypothetical protein